MSHVLVLFQANTEKVEQLALAVAVGAVEAEGSIRLRRLAAPDAPEVGHKSYGKLHAADLVWANVIVVGLEDTNTNPDELGPLFELLRASDLSGRRGWTFGSLGPDMPPTVAQLEVAKALEAAGVTMLPPGAAVGLDGLIARMKEWGGFSARNKERDV